jgi:hypothetical protein
VASRSSFDAIGDQRFVLGLTISISGFHFRQASNIASPTPLISISAEQTNNNA